MRCPACHEENRNDALVCERCQAVLKKMAPSGEIRQLSKEELEQVYQRFIAFADSKKGVLNEEIVAIVRQVLARADAIAAK